VDFTEEKAMSIKVAVFGSVTICGLVEMVVNDDGTISVTFDENALRLHRHMLPLIPEKYGNQSPEHMDLLRRTACAFFMHVGTKSVEAEGDIGVIQETDLSIPKANA
jgi:hypothetical protein